MPWSLRPLEAIRKRRFAVPRRGLLTPVYVVGYLSRDAAYAAVRAREELGWAPQVSLEEGMRRTEEWFRAQGMLPG